MAVWKKVLIPIALLVVGFVLSLITDNGVFFFFGLVFAVVLAVFFVVRRVRNSVKGKNLKELLDVSPETKRAKSEKYRFTVAGLSYRMDALYSVARRHKDFGLSDADFIAKHGNGRTVYEYDLKRGAKIELIPEPTNQHDSNAIAVYVDGAHVGYVPASETADVRQLLAAPYSVRGWIAGGARKSVQSGRVVTEATGVNMYVEITPPGDMEP